MAQWCNKSGKYGTTPLHEASRAGYKDIVDLLIKSNADYNKTNIFGATPLYEASSAGYNDIVELLITADFRRRNRGFTDQSV